MTQDYLFYTVFAIALTEAGLLWSKCKRIARVENQLSDMRMDRDGWYQAYGLANRVRTTWFDHAMKLDAKARHAAETRSAQCSRAAKIGAAKRAAKKEPSW